MKTIFKNELPPDFETWIAFCEVLLGIPGKMVYLDHGHGKERKQYFIDVHCYYFLYVG